MDKMRQRVRRFLGGETEAAGRLSGVLKEQGGMEMVQVAILIAIAVAAGIIFKSSVVEFVNRIFGNLDAANF
jgi:hypothetical protein